MRAPPPPTLRAFVAMRIGEPETDRLFEDSLLPILREVSFTAIPIDRVDFNDDIDDRIIEEIRNCDVVIADLTFARPSVYYEGGFATGLNKPVIYTARRDHLHAKDSDPMGNLKVHFDLQMKNIITWTDPASSTFQKAFRRRLRHVIAPIVRNRLEAVEALAARREFASLPLAERLETVERIVRGLLKAKGYALVDLAAAGEYRYRRAAQLAPHFPPPFKRLPDSILARGLVGVRQSSAAVDAVWVRIEPTLPLGVLNPMNTLVEYAPPHDMNPPHRIRPNRVVEHIVLCSLQAVPSSRMHSAFPSFKQQGSKQLAASFQHLVPTARIGEHLLLIGRLPYGGGMWQAIAFEPGTTSSSGVDYEISQGVIQRRRPGMASVFPPTNRRHRSNTETLGKVKEVPRQVSIHLLDGIDSIPVLEGRMATLGEQFDEHIGKATERSARRK